MAARVDPNQGLMASVLDRLIDPGTAGTDAQPGYNLSQMMESVHRDLHASVRTNVSRQKESYGAKIQAAAAKYI